MTTTTTAEIADRIDRLSDRMDRLIANVAPADWDAPTPCEEWTVRQLVGHVVEAHDIMLRPLDRSLSPAPSVDDDPLAAFRSARADVAAVLADPQLAATEYDGHFGPTHVQDTIDGFLGFDLVVHGWDLARATGQDTSIAPGEVDRIWAKAKSLGDALRMPGVCKEPVDLPPDASPQHRLLAFLGRDPR